MCGRGKVDEFGFMGFEKIGSIINVFEEDELDALATVRKFRTVQQEGKRTIERDINYNKLDVIISVGFRVKSEWQMKYTN